MDSIDAQLLRILAEDARCSATDISKKVNLSIPAVNKRISRLRENGIIERFTIQLNPQKINSSVQAFVLLVVDQYSRVNELLEFVNAKENIVDCYAITGEYDYQLRLYARDITELESILLELKGKKCVSKSHTIFVLMEHKHMLDPSPPSLSDSEHNQNCRRSGLSPPPLSPVRQLRNQEQTREKEM